MGSRWPAPPRFVLFAGLVLSSFLATIVFQTGALSVAELKTSFRQGEGERGTDEAIVLKPSAVVPGENTSAQHHPADGSVKDQQAKAFLFEVNNDSSGGVANEDENGSVPIVHADAGTSRQVLSDSDLARAGRRMFENNPVLYYGLHRHRYSSHYCYLGANKTTLVHDWLKRQCVFRNLGFDSDGTLVYHRDPKARDGGLPGFEKEDPKLLFKGYGAKFRFTSSPIVESQTYSRGRYGPNSRDFAVVLVNLQRSYALIPGHDWDYLFHTFNGLFQTGMLSLDNQLVLATMEKKSHSFSKIWNGLQRNTVTLTKFRQTHNSSLLPFVVAIPALVELINWPTLNSGLFATIIRDRVITNLGLPQPPSVYTTAASSVPVIRLRRKSASGHRFTNEEAIISHLRSKCIECQVLFFEPASLSMSEEVAAIASTHIYITPCGGGSMSAVLLPDGAAAIIGDMCFPVNKNSTRYNQTAFFDESPAVHCLHMDGPLWDAIPHLYTRYLTADRVESTNPERPRAYLRWNYEVNLIQLDGFVNDALRSMGFSRFTYDGANSTR